MAAMIGLVFPASSSRAVTITHAGHFTQDDDLQLIDFSVGAPSIVALRTWSYAGGVDGLGHVIPRGGFDPMLTLFDAAGVLIGESDDAGCALVGQDTFTGKCWDADLSRSLAAGSYTVALTEYYNHVNRRSDGTARLSDGFVYDGEGDFTPRLARSFMAPCHDAAGDPGAFVDVSGEFQYCARTNAWAVEIAGDGVVPGGEAVPEPGLLFVLGAGALALVGTARRAVSRPAPR